MLLQFHRKVAAVLCCTFALVAVSMAQSTNSGDIRGTVTDTTGALVPDVTVTVANVDTGVSKDFTTNHDGLFDTASIVVGKYLLTFKRQGFETLVRGPISIEAGYTTVNGQLQLGAATTQVTVNTDVPLLHTEGGDQTTTLEAHDMAELPNVGGGNGPDWENFMVLLPGAAGSAQAGSGSANPGQGVSTNGNLPYSNILADGASTTLPASQNANPAVFEDVQELQVSLSSFSAQYGVGGLIINQITKGGTSTFHGTAYEYFQNDALNAANYGFGNKVSVPFQRYNNYGGTVSGPILKKKMFFFFGYDRLINNGVYTGFNTIPTAQVEAGNFGDGYTIYDPTTQTIGIDSAGNPYPVRKSFKEEYGSNAIPANLIDSVSAKFEQYYPTESNHIPFGHFVQGTPSTSGSGVLQNNFYAATPAPYPWRRYFGRLDYDITPSNRVTLSDTQGDEIENSDSSVTACPIGCQLGDVDNNNAQVTDVWNISPTTINEVRFGFTDQLNFFSDAGTGKNIPQDLGWKFAKGNVLPQVQFLRNYPYAWIGPATNAEYKEMVFDPSDVVTMIRGKHILHFGGEMAFYRDDSTPWGNINGGTLAYSGSYTENWTLDAKGVASANTSSGEEYADFLLGYAQNWNAAISPEFGARLKKPQMFLQDDYKIKPNLTLNLGLRYEISHGFNEVSGNEATFDPTLTNPSNGTPGAMWFGSTHTNGRKSLQADVFSTILPRAGFSWAPKSNMTLRGGFGVYSYNFSTDGYGTGLAAAFSDSGSYNDNSNGIYPVTKFSGNGTLFPLGGGAVAPLPYSAASTSPTRFNGQGTNYSPFHTPIPKIYQWNFGAERQLSPNFVATLTYVASHGFNLAYPTDINAVPETELSSNDASTCGSGVTAGCDRPYTNYQGIDGTLYESISNYDSLQAVITKRLNNGLSFSFNYVWSHMLDDQDSSGGGSYHGPQNYQHASTLTANLAHENYGPSNFDVRNAFKGYAVYQLPVGKGKQFLNHNALLDEAIGGWEISATVLESSGNPFQITTNGTTYNQSPGAQFPNVVPGVSPRPAHRSVSEWYNPSAFSAPANGTFGDAQRNPLVGPGLNEVNLSGGKTFDLGWEGVKFNLRCDATNAFNHPSFGVPNGSLSTSQGSNIFTGPGSEQITSTTVGGRVVQISGRFSF
jgi:hypothetical protein